MAESKRKPGRPKKTLDKERIQKLASLHLTVEEIAAVEGVNKKTLERRCKKELEAGRLTARASIKRKQMELAKAGNVTMLIWLGKNYCEQTDKVENTHTFGTDLKAILTK